MQEEILPTLARLTSAFEQSGATTQQIVQILKNAEEDAANSFLVVGETPVGMNSLWPFIPTSVIASTGALFSSSESRFDNKWDSWSLDQRRSFLVRVYDELATEHALPSVDVKFEDLPDKNLWGLTIVDAKGIFRGGDLAIDIDNLEGSNQRDVLNTLIHETRHQIQWEAVISYRSDGDQMQLPQGITLEQVQTWDDNFQNYIKGDDDFQGYREQPIEKDARSFADHEIRKIIKRHFGELTPV